MAKLGDYSYPNDLDPDEAEDLLDTLVNDYGGEATNRQAFAQAIGHKSKESGAFIRKIGDARKYGLITPRGDYEATELGFRLANPTSEADRRQIYYKMLSNIEVLADVYDELNGNAPPDDFWRVLTETADVNPKDAREAAERIEYLYQRMLKFYVGEDEPDGESTVETSEEDEAPVEKSTKRPDQQADAAIYVKVGDEEMRFSEITNTRIELVRQYLESMKESDDETVQASLEETP